MAIKSIVPLQIKIRSAKQGKNRRIIFLRQCFFAARAAVQQCGDSGDSATMRQKFIASPGDGAAGGNDIFHNQNPRPALRFVFNFILRAVLFGFFANDASIAKRQVALCGA